MRHTIEVPSILEPEHRVPELRIEVEEERLSEFLEEHYEALITVCDVFSMTGEKLRPLITEGMIDALKEDANLPAEERQRILAGMVATGRWIPVKKELIKKFYAEIKEQALAYTMAQHVTEIPFENSEESQQRLETLVADILAEDRVAKYPIDLLLEKRGTVTTGDLRRQLDSFLTFQVKDIYTVLDQLEEPLFTRIYTTLFNDTAPTKFSLEMLSRAESITDEELLTWAKMRPNFWMQEMLGNRSRTIDHDPNIAGDEKLTQKAAAYQLLKEIFINNEMEPEPQPEKKPRRLKHRPKA